MLLISFKSFIDPDKCLTCDGIIEQISVAVKLDFRLRKPKPMSTEDRWGIFSKNLVISDSIDGLDCRINELETLT
jgi:hypothetical protein